MRTLLISVSLLATLAAVPMATAACTSPAPGVFVCQESYGNYASVGQSTPAGYVGAYAAQYNFGSSDYTFAGAYTWGSAGYAGASAACYDYNGDGNCEYSSGSIYSGPAYAYFYDYMGNGYICSTATGCMPMP